MPEKPNWVIQKVIKADTLQEALANEKDAEIVEVVKAVWGSQKLEPAIGFTYEPNRE